MSGNEPIRAVIADMDGVLTRTARVHERAWKLMFDEFLHSRPDQQPFSSEDYRAHVDGKPRYDGVADFLGSRGIELPHGDPDDPPDRETVCGLGNRKNRIFLELLERDGVETFGDAIEAVARWRRGDLPVAVISASRNCRHVLEAAGLLSRFDLVVDGQDAVERKLSGKRDILLEAARLLDVGPGDAVVLEDATAGVRAASEAGFGRVFGVARDDGAAVGRLESAGAADVVADLRHVRFPRRIPHVLELLDELASRQGDRKLSVFLDYDGTLTPIVDDPADAVLSADMREALRDLAAARTVAIVSGRDLRDVRERVGIEQLVYAGNHGFDIDGAGLRKTLPEAEDALPDVERAQRELESELARVPGFILERKRFSVAAHYRQVDSGSDVDKVKHTVESVARRTGLKVRTGKQVLELEPAVEWDKGRAIQWLTEALPALRERDSFMVYAGDDETDEDAFAVLSGRGAGIRIGDAVTDSLADYRAAGPDEVRTLLERFAGSTFDRT